MSEEYDEAQMGEEGGMPGPGAPTPLFALEVRILQRPIVLLANMLFQGNCWFDKERHPACYRWRLQHCGVRGLHTTTSTGADQGYF